MDDQVEVLKTRCWADVMDVLCVGCRHGVKRKWADIMQTADDRRDRQGMDDATYEFTVVVTRKPRLTIKALPPEIIDLIFAHVSTAYGPAVDSVCRGWHRLWGGRHHFVNAKPEIEWALRGHHRLLKWARSRGWIHQGDGIATAAAKNGHLEIVRWCLKHKLVVDARTRAALARGGHLNMLQWLHAQKCPLDDKVCVAAAKGGHFAVLQWARIGVPVVQDARERRRRQARTSTCPQMALVRTRVGLFGWSHMGLLDVCRSGWSRPHRVAAVASGQGLPVGLLHHLRGGSIWSRRRGQVGSDKRVRVERDFVCTSGLQRRYQPVALDEGQWMPVGQSYTVLCGLGRAHPYP
ncbi:Ankyrin repeat domain containing protein [Pandoravirus salinus]|uniref:Ankyrin repeat domain containing protein n=1 Tax=Pandoravirus salinus TaxID=1349410 RepID=S4VWL5_9VIRU|nr:ankyrin repeat domain [Pandoravirus salinus]AGO84763.1 Ankyrin repeat domain containing protein [Pandoravirus salinus]